MSLAEFAQDYFLDTASLRRYVETGANSLGEPSFHPTAWPSISGLLLLKTSRLWRDLGLSDDTEAIFLCDPFAIPEGRFLLSCNGTEYRVMSWETARGLDGVSSMRFTLKRSAQ